MIVRPAMGGIHVPGRFGANGAAQLVRPSTGHIADGGYIFAYQSNVLSRATPNTPAYYPEGMDIPTVLGPDQVWNGIDFKKEVVIKLEKPYVRRSNHHWQYVCWRVAVDFRYSFASARSVDWTHDIIAYAIVADFDIENLTYNQRGSLVLSAAGVSDTIRERYIFSTHTDCRAYTQAWYGINVHTNTDEIVYGLYVSLKKYIATNDATYFDMNGIIYNKVFENAKPMFVRTID